MIELANLSKIYHTRQGRRTVLDGINLRVAKGEKIGVLGRNGAGKSTMIRMISGAELPSAGKIRRGMSVSCASSAGCTAAMPKRQNRSCKSSPNWGTTCVSR
jgi:ABC-type polysaccharide/polyol phosphate transport system ATPase subunit